MADTCTTFKAKPWGQGQGEFVEVNVSEFNAELHEPLDAEEALKVGIEPAKPEGDDEDDDKGGAMKISDIRAALTAKGVEFDPKAKKADLRALLEAQG